MPLILQAEHQVLVDNEEYQAIKQSGYIEIWDKEGSERYGVLPEHYTLLDIERLMSFYRNGFMQGEKVGQQAKLNEIRTALNV